MHKLREDEDGDPKPIMKNNVLPFPALQAAPRDPPKPTLLRALGTLLLLGIALGLLALTFWALLG